MKEFTSTVTLTFDLNNLEAESKEDYMSSDRKSNDPDLPKEIDNIFEELEGTIDKHYDKIEAAKKKQPKAEW